MRGWLRQAGAALIGVISVLMISHAFASNKWNGSDVNIAYANSVPIIPVAKQCEPWVVEAIRIANLSPNIQMPFVRHDMLNITFSELHALGAHHFCAGLYDKIFSIKFVFYREVLSAPVFGNLHAKEPSYIPGRHLADITDTNADNSFSGPAQIVIREWFDPMRSDRDIGPQFTLSRVLSIADQPPGRSPQQPSEYPKSAGDDNQTARKPGYPPVWIRIPLALVLGLGSNGVVAWGLLLTLNNKRRTWGRILIGWGLVCLPVAWGSVSLWVSPPLGDGGSDAPRRKTARIAAENVFSIPGSPRRRCRRSRGCCGGTGTPRRTTAYIWRSSCERCRQHRV